MGEGVAYVPSAARSSCTGSLEQRLGLGRGVDLTRGQGSGEAQTSLEARARASRSPLLGLFVGPRWNYLGPTW